MLFSKKQQVKIIHSNTAEEFEEKLNRYLCELSKIGVKYELTFNNSLGFCAYLIYTETVSIPESLAEEHELSGDRHYCTECVNCIIPNDKRIRHYDCDLHGCRCTQSTPCCDEFYADMANFLRKEEYSNE